MNEKFRRIDEKLFNAIQCLLSAGATANEVKKYYGVSSATCTRIRHSATYSDYKKWFADRALEKKEQKNEATVILQQEANTIPNSSDSVAAHKPVSKENNVQIVEYKHSVQVQATHYMMTELQKTNELLTGISAKLAFLVEQWS